ncbi:MAG: disulfide bond formation protein DsbA [Acidocella sp. 35-58-6]|nr:MAG: disulfide bond formation protein DsbA [Acidocella sp. 35-58-6]
MGIQRLAFLLARRPDLSVDLMWRPFLLNPDMPRQGMSRTDYMVRKFGAEDRAKRLYASITEIAAAEGIVFNFGNIRRTPSSVDAHRLVRHIAPLGVATSLVHLIFRAHFIEGLDIGNTDILVAIAAAQGLDPYAIRTFLTSGEGIEFVHAENLHAHRLGINGVPCFLIDGDQAIAGAQEPEVLERLIDLAACTPRL